MNEDIHDLIEGLENILIKYDGKYSVYLPLPGINTGEHLDLIEALEEGYRLKNAKNDYSTNQREPRNR